MKRPVFKRNPRFGVPLYIIPKEFIHNFRTLDPEAVAYRSPMALLVFYTKLLGGEYIGEDTQNGDSCYLSDFEVQYHPTDSEVVNALRGPAGQSCVCRVKGDAE